MKYVWRLLAYLRPHWLGVALSFLALLFGTLLNLTVPWLIKRVIDFGLKGDIRVLSLSSAAIIGVGILRFFVGYGQRYSSGWIAYVASYDLRNALFQRVQSLSFKYHDQEQTGQLMSRMTSDIAVVQRFFSVGLLDSMNLILLSLGVTIAMWQLNPQLTFYALAPFPLLAVFATRFVRIVRHLWRSAQERFAYMTAVLQENLTGAQVVRAFARERYEVDKFKQANREFMDRRLKTIYTWAETFPLMTFIAALSSVLVFWFGGAEVIAGKTTVGTVVAFNGYVMLLAMPVRRLGAIINLYGEAIGIGERLFEVLDTVSPVREKPDAVELPHIEGHVCFEHVDFGYSTTKEAGESGEQMADVLTDINLNVPVGRMIALIGQTGSGKTSLVNLIPRFYDVTAGRVTVDGYDVRDVTLASLRRQIGVVLQDTLLFSVTIAENIAYGRPDATEEEIEAAAKAAQADEFICQMPKGYQTTVGPRGVTLSGGQRQRIAIARALLVNPRILILDDSTSSVDTETEYKISQTLYQLMVGRTSFIIAHRLATVKKADEIIVLHRGRIVQQGTHEELLAQGGYYREIYDLQLRDQENVAAAAMGGAG